MGRSPLKLGVNSASLLFWGGDGSLSKFRARKKQDPKTHPQKPRVGHPAPHSNVGVKPTLPGLVLGLAGVVGRVGGVEVVGEQVAGRLVFGSFEHGSEDGV
jgi:hypothetical protein